MKKRPKVLFLVTEDWYFWSHRLSLARAARERGYEVLVATRVNQHGDRIQREGFKLLPLVLRRGSMNPLRELWAVIDLVRIYRRERPDLVHQVAMKPILYGSWAAKITKTPAIVNAVAGVGSAFVAQGWKAAILRRFIVAMYKVAFSLTNMKVIFQNVDDLEMFLSRGIVNAQNAVVIKGVGVDVTTFQPVPESNHPPLVVLASRMLWEKGVKEFVEAVETLHAKGIKARFALVGDTDIENPSGIPMDQLVAWKNKGIVEWWGHCEEMASVFHKAHIVCLPSYREGMPRVLMEAAACGRAIVTTDTPGCREVVRHGENGLLVPARDSTALADALQRLIENADMRVQMGVRGREIAATEFSEQKVIHETLALYGELLDVVRRSEG